MPSTLQLVLSTRADPGLPLGALRAHGHLLELRADDLRFTAPEAQSSSTAGWARPGRRRRRSARLAHRGLARRDLPGRAVAGRQAGQARPGAGFDGTSAHVVDFLSSEVLGAYEPELQAFSSGPRCSSGFPSRCATRCSTAAARRRRWVAGALEPVPRAARRPAPLVPLPPSVRPAPARRAGAARAAARAGPAPARVRVARRVRHDRRGDPPRRRGTRVRRGRLADRRDLGPLRQRRPHVVRPRLAAALPAGDARRRRPPAARAGLDLGPARQRAGHARRAGPARRLGELEAGPLPDGFASLESSLSC